MFFDSVEAETDEQRKLLRQSAAENVTKFMGTDTKKYVTLSFNSCGGLANMVSFLFMSSFETIK